MNLIKSNEIKATILTNPIHVLRQSMSSIQRSRAPCVTACEPEFWLPGKYSLFSIIPNTSFLLGGEKYMLVTFYKELRNNEKKEGMLYVDDLNIFQAVHVTSQFRNSINYHGYIVFYNEAHEDNKTPSLRVPTAQGIVNIYGDFLVNSINFYDEYLTKRLDVEAGLDKLILR